MQQRLEGNDTNRNPSLSFLPRLTGLLYCLPSLSFLLVLQQRQYDVSDKHNICGYDRRDRRVRRVSYTEVQRNKVSWMRRFVGIERTIP